MQVGIDLVEHKDIINKDKRFIQRILSNLEYEKYLEITNEKRKIEYIASRFAGKEAIFKCYKESDKGYNFSDYSILNKKNGAPYVIYQNQEQKDLHISLSHTANYSVAIVILQACDDD